MWVQLQLWNSLRHQRWERVEQLCDWLLAHPACLGSYRADALRCRALVHMRAGRQKEALQDAGRALEICRDPARSWLIRGLVLFHFKHHEVSLQAFEQCLLLARPWRLSIRRPAQRFQGLCLLALGRVEALEPLLGSGLATSEELASASALAGRYQQALTLLGPGQPRMRLAELLLHHRQLGAAHFWIRRQLELETSVDGLLLAGRIALELGNRQEACQHFWACLSLGRSPRPEALLWYVFSAGGSLRSDSLVELAGQLWQPVVTEGRAQSVGPYFAREVATARN